MNFTITLGWWLLPALVTVVMAVWAVGSWCEDKRYDFFINFVGAITATLVAATIVGFCWAVFFAVMYFLRK